MPETECTRKINNLFSFERSRPNNSISISGRLVFNYLHEISNSCFNLYNITIYYTDTISVLILYKKWVALFTRNNNSNLFWPQNKNFGKGYTSIFLGSGNAKWRRLHDGE